MENAGLYQIAKTVISIGVAIYAFRGMYHREWQEATFWATILVVATAGLP